MNFSLLLRIYTQITRATKKSMNIPTVPITLTERSFMRASAPGTSFSCTQFIMVSDIPSSFPSRKVISSGFDLRLSLSQFMNRVIAAGTPINNPIMLSHKSGRIMIMPPTTTSSSTASEIMVAKTLASLRSLIGFLKRPLFTW